ncbi:acyltransferase [Fontibacillus sp. BL9]|uniref:acyltransferase n=1 Tax=Fontibacillus sp. BL9 TaxID=3389971 RepID=UPI00397BC3E1
MGSKGKEIIKERLPQLELFRAFAIFCVIQVHASSTAAAEQALTSPIYYFYNWMNMFFKIGTTSFIFLSSFVLFYNYSEKRLDRKLVGGFYKKRLVSIIIPYVLVSCCYYVVVAWQNNRFLNKPIMDQLKLLGSQLLTGTAYTHLYFIIINIQFYILFPLMLKLLQCMRGKRGWLGLIFPAGLALQWGFYFWNKYQLHLPNKGSYALSYMSYYLLGAVLAIYFDKIKLWLTADWRSQPVRNKICTIALWASWLAVTFYHIQLWYEYRLGLNSWSTLWFEVVWNVHTLLSALVLLKAAFLVYRKCSPFLVKALTRLGELSFGIYLFHPIVLREYRFIRHRVTFSPNSVLYLVYILGGSLCALVLSWMFVRICFKRLPFASWFLGKAPDSMKRTTVKNSGGRLHADRALK